MAKIPDAIEPGQTSHVTYNFVAQQQTRRQISTDQIWQAREQVTDALIASIRQLHRIDAAATKEHSR